jgi:hypothetical protein
MAALLTTSVSKLILGPAAGKKLVGATKLGGSVSKKYARGRHHEGWKDFAAKIFPAFR